jgi:hypothetical protein
MIQSQSRFIAEGSSVGIEWKKTKFKSKELKNKTPTKICVGMQQTLGVKKMGKGLG